ncbi:hypothetical protein [Vulcanisaeta distributa]|uniref:Uncharacterized protein n=1 Tax=Vulcanisaeta distributa (strain DSM 14429 / JCM 11212 / NBRC 100878 / IC-017) TaxID=572478 RepID=E1QNX1_VULDI|nr:hypothetical protein [Vulcanisaeta distributa]ADN51336.1 conserved hypothetical protein [Vulcanisaeta distributa DSM 14429]
MLNIQRSIPIPRISLEKLINYILTVGDNPGINCSALKDRGLEIGKGRGDITRFFQRIGVVEVYGDCNIRLTDVGNALYMALNRDVALSKMLFHLILYKELPHYRLLINLISEEGPLSITELHRLINQRIRELSPTAWLNEVAFKAIIGLAVDLGVVEVVNGEVSIRYTASISECIRRAMVLIGSQKVLRLDDLNACIKQLLGNIDIKQLLIGSLDGCVEPIIAPGPLGPKSTYFKVLNEDCVVKQVVNVILNRSMLGGGH